MDQGSRQPWKDHRDSATIQHTTSGINSSVFTPAGSHVESVYPRRGAGQSIGCSKENHYINGSSAIHLTLSLVPFPFMFDNGDDNAEGKGDKSSKYLSTCLQCARPALLKAVTCITSLKPHQGLGRQVLSLSSFSRCGNGGTRR